MMKTIFQSLVLVAGLTIAGSAGAQTAPPDWFYAPNQSHVLSTAVWTPYPWEPPDEEFPGGYYVPAPYGFNSETGWHSKWGLFIKTSPTTWEHVDGDLVLTIEHGIWACNGVGGVVQ